MNQQWLKFADSQLFFFTYSNNFRDCLVSPMIIDDLFAKRDLTTSVKLYIINYVECAWVVLHYDIYDTLCNVYEYLLRFYLTNSFECGIV